MTPTPPVPRTFRSAWPLPLFLLLAGACAANPARDADAPEPEGVAVGYGTQPAERVTGAIASLSGEEIGDAHASRVEELIRGRLPGVQVIRLPGGEFTVRIRGAGTLNSSGEPLFVIDGVPVVGISPGRALEGIRPADIQRIDVLKDAGSAAIYGVRAANGVIVVTTRRRR